MKSRFLKAGKKAGRYAGKRVRLWSSAASVRRHRMQNLRNARALGAICAQLCERDVQRLAECAAASVYGVEQIAVGHGGVERARVVGHLSLPVVEASNVAGASA